MMNRIAMLLVVIGALNWGLVGLFKFDLVAAIFGGGSPAGIIARLVYVLVGISGALLIPSLMGGEKKS